MADLFVHCFQMQYAKKKAFACREFIERCGGRLNGG